MNRRMFALAGLALAPAASTLLPMAVDARKKKRKPRPKPRPTRKVVTRTYVNPSEIRLPDMAQANPYPSTITVKDLPKGRLLSIIVKLNGFTHDRPFDAALMLVGPSGKSAVLLHNVGGQHTVTNLSLTLDDQATASMPNNPDIKLTTGTYKPTAFGITNGLFPAPAPQGVTNTALATFTGDDPNGEWRLFAVDDAFQLTGALTGGWSLDITAEITVKKKQQRQR